MDLSLFAHQSVIIETSKRDGDPGQRVAGLDPVRLEQAPAVLDGRVDGDGLEQRAVVEERAADAVLGDRSRRERRVSHGRPGPWPRLAEVDVGDAC